MPERSRIVGLQRQRHRASDHARAHRAAADHDHLGRVDRLDLLRRIGLERLVGHDLGADGPVPVEDDALDLVLGDDAQVLVGRLGVEKVVRDVAALAGVVVDPLGRADVS